MPLSPPPPLTPMEPASLPGSRTQIDMDHPALYKVTHVTTYNYTESVPISHNQVHLTPRELRYQTTRFHRLIIRPTPAAQTRRVDYFGNQETFFNIQKIHSRFSITAVSRIEVRKRNYPAADQTPDWENVAQQARSNRSSTWLDAFQFTFPSPRISTGEVFAEYGRTSFTANRPILEAAKDLTSRIHQEFKFDSNATDVNTTVETVMQNKCGVCQDLAHVQLAILRSLGIPARYVSGYILTHPAPGQPRMVGADASHAWVSVYCGEEVGWVDFDPTNDVLPATEHITVAWGRDYGDICPIKGVIFGGGSHRVEVGVTVAPLDATEGSESDQETLAEK